jgi:putative tryptophan/tyrosine transport system substrate-binding protein
MRRREFLGLLGGAAAAWPLAARAQQPSVPVVGYLSSGTAVVFADMADAFRLGLSEAGYVAGHNVTIEYRWAEGQYDRLPSLAADLVQRRAAVIVVSGGAVSALAAKTATATIPIVFIMGDDPVQYGLVASLNRPGSNITGVNLFVATLVAKRIELLTELVPTAASIALLSNPTNPNSSVDVQEAHAAAAALGKQLQVMNASNESEIDAAFGSIAKQRIGAAVIGTDIFFTNRRPQVVRLAAEHAVPTMHIWRESVVAGGLVSYGISHTEPYRQAAGYTARILKGEKPTDLPVLQPTKFELVINLKTAKGLSLQVPAKLLALADEVIE